jgi:hypothetical protein
MLVSPKDRRAVARAKTITLMHTTSPPSRSAADTVWTATGHERPVFLDERGRRRRLVLAGGVSAGAAAAIWFVTLIAGAIGFSTLPSLRAPVPLFAQRTEVRDIALDTRHRRVALASGRRGAEPVRAAGLAAARRRVSTE